MSTANVVTTKIISLGKRFTKWLMIDRPQLLPLVQIATAYVLIGGAHTDGFMHYHNLVATLEGFLSRAHVAFYLAYAGCAGLMIFTYGRHRRIIPALKGYEISWYGVLLFVVGGVFDYVWHGIYGIEQNLEGLVSPSHIILEIAIAMIILGGLAWAWHKFPPGKLTWKQAFIPLSSATLFLAALNQFMSYAHPQGSAGPSYHVYSQIAVENGWAVYTATGLALVGIIVVTACMVAVMTLLSRRWQLPFGSYAFMFFLISVFVSVFYDSQIFIISGVAAGIGADILAAVLKIQATNSRLRVLLFAGAVPLIYYSAYYALILGLLGGTWWSTHLWVGSIVFGILASVGIIAFGMLWDKNEAAKPQPLS